MHLIWNIRNSGHLFLIQWNSALELMNMITSAQVSFQQNFFFKALAIGCWHIWCRSNDLIFNNVTHQVDKWKSDFLRDFALHMHRAKDSDKPNWQSLMQRIS